MPNTANFPEYKESTTPKNEIVKDKIIRASDPTRLLKLKKLLESTAKGPRMLVSIYNLDEMCQNIHDQGFSDTKVAKDCTDYLRLNGPKDEYIEITATDVKEFLELKKQKEDEAKAIANQKRDKTLLQLQKEVPEVGDTLRTLLATLNSEIEKMRLSGAPVEPKNQEFFLKLAKELRECIGLAGNVQEKLQPSVMVAIVINKFKNLMKKIQALEIPVETKSEILRLLASEASISEPVRQLETGKERKLKDIEVLPPEGEE